MDTSTLMVGEYVQLRSGCYGAVGKVAKVTPSGVEVQTSSGVTKRPYDLWRFDINGKACDSTGTGMFEPGSWEHNGIPSTFECGPWEITEFDYNSGRP
jgi:hypothetical protein